MLLVNLALTANAAPPSINFQPKDQTVVVYQPTGFGVIAGPDAAALSYQWRKDEVPIAGATNDHIAFTQPQLSDAGRYSAVVSNAEGSVTSTDALLTVTPPKAGDVDYSFFTLGTSINDVQSVAIQLDGKILIAGSFSTVDGAARGRVARLNADGTADYTFMEGLSGADGPVNSVAVQSDGKVLVGGSFTNVNGVSRNGIARLTADGSLDSGFQPATSGSVYSLTLQSDGKILVGGSFTNVNGVSRINIARLNTDGTLDSDFQSPLNGDVGSVFSAVVQSDGKVLIGGYFFPGPYRTLYSYFARLNADGSLDNGFLTWVSGGSVSSVAVQSDGKVLLGGSFTNVNNGATRHGIARVNADGSLDNDFQNALFNDHGFVTSVRVQTDGKVIIGSRFGMARLNAEGTLDSSFHLNSSFHLDFQTTVSRSGYSVTLQRDGKVLVGGFFGIARLNEKGTLDSGFANGLSTFFGVYAPVSSLWGHNSEVQHDGKVLVDLRGGGIARVNADGTLDSGFQPATKGIVASLAVQSDGKVLVGGFFTTVNGVSRKGIARLNADGTLDSGFLLREPSFGANTVESIAVQNDGKVLISRSHRNGEDLFPELAGIARLWGADYPPLIKNINRSGTDVSLIWYAISNRTYRVQYTGNLSATNWTDLAGDVSAIGVMAGKTDTTLGAASQRFYRVLLLP